MFLIFISGFGSQSWHLVTVMEQSIRDTLYKRIKGKGRRQGGGGSKMTQYLRRDSFHYMASGKKGGKKRGREVVLMFILL